MARRKRKEDEPDWTPPEFDEVSYMRKEIESAQVALVIIGWSAVGALLAWVLYQYNAVVGFLAGLGAFAVLFVLLPLIGLRTDKFKTRDWAGHASIYFFCWLAFFIIILNPPFGDHTPPTIQFLAAGTYLSASGADPAPGSVYCVPAIAGTTVNVPQGTGANNTLYVTFRATDNVAISRVNVSVDGVATAAQVVDSLDQACKSAAGTVYNPGTYALKLTIPPQKRDVQVIAWDTAGFSATAGASFQIG